MHERVEAVMKKTNYTVACKAANYDGASAVDDNNE